MLRGNIPCTWDLNDIKNLDYEMFYYEGTMLKTLLDVKDTKRYNNIGFYRSRNFDLSMFDFVNTEFSWVQDPLLQINNVLPGTILPLHTDIVRYNKEYNINKDRVVRIILYLENWFPGQYFEVEGHGITNWQAGDWVGFGLDSIHLSANLGHTNRYALQITGTNTQ